ncbi:hypothetical protein KIN20_034860 [Parelaphostrongylus tenuis]|uniref:Uncharacterized protein n=1 Tax=Parelaphostrongylus tenuis TaxID=148309 RepID=A0AAD5RAD1_PARTN|nr:hypothetical protein KIN20_034860 [Parelaphostrongylus tenuis]
MNAVVKDLVPWERAFFGSISRNSAMKQHQRDDWWNDKTALTLSEDLTTGEI